MKEDTCIRNIIHFIHSQINQTDARLKISIFLICIAHTHVSTVFFFMFKIHLVFLSIKYNSPFSLFVCVHSAISGPLHVEMRKARTIFRINHTECTEHPAERGASNCICFNGRSIESVMVSYVDRAGKQGKQSK